MGQCRKMIYLQILQDSLKILGPKVGSRPGLGVPTGQRPQSRNKSVNGMLKKCKRCWRNKSRPKKSTNLTELHMFCEKVRSQIQPKASHKHVDGYQKGLKKQQQPRDMQPNISIFVCIFFNQSNSVICSVHYSIHKRINFTNAFLYVFQ